MPDAPRLNAHEKKRWQELFTAAIGALADNQGETPRHIARQAAAIAEAALTVENDRLSLALLPNEEPDA